MTTDARERLYFATYEALERRERWLRGCVRICHAVAPHRPGAARQAVALASLRAALLALAAIEPEDFDAAAWCAGPHAALTRDALAECVADLEADLAAARDALALLPAVPAPTAALERS